MPIHYLKITLVDGTRFILRVTRETPTIVSGIEVDAAGDEVVPRGPGGYHNRQRIVERALVKRAVPLRMSPKYATLEPVPRGTLAGARKKSSAQLDAEIAEALSGPEWLVARKKERVDPKTYTNLIKKAVKFPEFTAPAKYTWDLVPHVPIHHLDPGSKFDYETDPESDEDEVGENLERYYRVENLLIHEGKRRWPVVVNADGDVIDGHHRLAVLNDHDVQTVDVLWVRPKGRH